MKQGTAVSTRHLRYTRAVDSSLRVSTRWLMAFCNSCGATLSAGTKFCNKCGAAVAAAAPTPGVTPASVPPTTGGSSALKIILIVVAVIVGIGILGVVR